MVPLDYIGSDGSATVWMSRAMRGAGFCAGWGLGGTRRDEVEKLAECCLELFGTHGQTMWCANYAGRSISENLFQLGLPLGARGGKRCGKMRHSESGTSAWKGQSMSASPTRTMCERQWALKWTVPATVVEESLAAAASDEWVLCTYSS